MFFNSLILFVGLLVSLFIFWKRLKEDYSSEIIFNSIFTIYTTFLISILISSKFLPIWFFWIQFAGILIGLTIAVYKNKIRFYESFEPLIFSFTPLLTLLFLRDAALNSSFSSFLAFTFMLILIFVFYYVDSHYKNFVWYRSGKIGLSGLLILFLFFVIRATTSVFLPYVLSFSGKIEPFISGLSAGTVAVSIFILGRTEK